jgi:hypothetical protein
MIKEWNILTLENMLRDDSLTPLKKYFIWEMIKELKEEIRSNYE